MSNRLTVSSKSTIYLKQQVTSEEDGDLTDPTGSSVSLQLVAPGSDPDDSSWTAGTWETDSTVTPTKYYARLLVGPDGDVTTTDGTYRLWVKVTDNPETPVLPGGIVVIT